MAESNNDLVERFYAALAARDGEGMAACYSQDVTSPTPCFPASADQRRAVMWKFLTSRSADLQVELHEHEAGDSQGSAHWIAHYIFTQTGRPVINDVRAQFHFAGGLIVEHRDEFDFHRWASQALGRTGMLLGWTPMLRGAVRRQAREGLDRYMASSR